MKTGYPIFDALLEQAQVVEGRPRVLIDDGRLCISLDDSGSELHELLHIFLRHWTMCGVRKNLAADLALQSFLPEPEGLMSDSPIGWHAERYMKQYVDGTFGYEFGRRLQEVDQLVGRVVAGHAGYITAHLSDPELPLDVQLAIPFLLHMSKFPQFETVIKKVEKLPDELLAATFRGSSIVRWLRSEGIATLLQLDKAQEEVALDALRSQPGPIYANVPFRKGGIAYATAVGSLMNRNLSSQVVLAGWIHGCTLTGCTVDAFEISSSTLISTRVCGGMVVNCVLKDASLDSSIESRGCNLNAGGDK